VPQQAKPITALSVSRLTAWVCVSAYLVIGLGMAWLSRFEMTPDGFAYVQIARHYANGSLPLAVNSWWGPLLPWLLVPFIWMKMHPIFAARLLSIVFGLGFAAGVSALVRGMTGGRGWLIALVMGLMASLTMLPRYLSPDMLLACLITWYFVKTMKLLRSDSIGLAAAVGLLGGLAYLTKAYALPFVLFHLAGTVFFKSLLAGRSVTKASLKQYAAAITVLLLVAAPWILTISIHDGRPTLGSAAKYASAWSGNESLGGMPFTRLQLPREGRIWTWEDPAETHFPWPTWSASDGVEGLKKQIRVAGANIVSLPALLNTADAFQLMSGGFILVLVFLFPLRRTLTSRPDAIRLWAALSILLYMGGYVSLFVYDRYLWPTWGIMFALFIVGPPWLRVVSTAGENNDLTDRPGATSQTLTYWHRLILSVFVVSLSANAITEARARLNGKAHAAARFKQVGEKLKAHHLFASNRWRTGLYVTYWANGRFLGQAAGKTPDEVAAELAPFDQSVLLVFDDFALANALTQSPLFISLPIEKGGTWAFRLRSPPERSVQ